MAWNAPDDSRNRFGTGKRLWLQARRRRTPRAPYQTFRSPAFAPPPGTWSAVRRNDEARYEAGKIHKLAPERKLVPGLP